MSDLTCIIVEDEPLAVKILAGYISQVPFLELKGSFRDALLATEFLHQNRVDLIFLDIHLPKLKGLAFLKTLSAAPAVIVTTAYHQYAVEGFELNVDDYLLKPFSFERFLAAVNKVRRATPPAEAPPARDHLFLMVQKKKVRVRFTEILFVESQREYVRVVTTTGELLSKISTQELEDLLPPLLFRRVHRSLIVALARIDSFNSEEVEIGPHHIPVGRAYRQVIDEL
ncbi:MAG: response regulator transcription factor [Sphingobacteriales bacterium]|nr:MAG: response regulator transcription factor [Sphingobacteriales bacterium]